MIGSHHKNSEFAVLGRTFSEFRFPNQLYPHAHRLEPKEQGIEAQRIVDQYKDASFNDTELPNYIDALAEMAGDSKSPKAKKILAKEINYRCADNVNLDQIILLYYQAIPGRISNKESANLANTLLDGFKQCVQNANNLQPFDEQKLKEESIQRLSKIGERLRTSDYPGPMHRMSDIMASLSNTDMNIHTFYNQFVIFSEIIKDTETACHYLDKLSGTATRFSIEDAEDTHKITFGEADPYLTITKRMTRLYEENANEVNLKNISISPHLSETSISRLFYFKDACFFYSATSFDDDDSTQATRNRTKVIDMLLEKKNPKTHQVLQWTMSQKSAYENN